MMAFAMDSPVCTRGVASGNKETVSLLPELKRFPTPSPVRTHVLILALLPGVGTGSPGSGGRQHRNSRPPPLSASTHSNHKKKRHPTGGVFQSLWCCQSHAPAVHTFWSSDCARSPAPAQPTRCNHISRVSDIAVSNLYFSDGPCQSQSGSSSLHTCAASGS